VYIRLLPESYKDLVDPVRKSFPFRPGLSASADIQTKTHADRLAVPINAVTTRDKSDTAGVNNKNQKSDASSDNSVINADDLEEVVFILQPDGQVKKVKVRTDIQDINYIEILAGLKEGDEVITGPYDVVSKTLKEGTKVKVVPKSELFDKKK
jgi:HlyD family secretion protein